MPPVAGGPVEFVITRPEEPAVPSFKRHGLMLGYVATSALLDLEGATHGVGLAYEFGVHRYVTLGATLEYARSSHTNPSGEGFQLHRLAALVGVAARLELFRRFTGRAELYLGYQGYFGSGPVWINNTNVGESSDSMGFRLETGLGARFDITSFLFADIRGGLAVELITLERKGETEEHAHTAPYGAASLGVRF